MFDEKASTFDGMYEPLPHRNRPAPDDSRTGVTDLSWPAPGFKEVTFVKAALSPLTR
jgi:hypothetical protein